MKRLTLEESKTLATLMTKRDIASEDAGRMSRWFGMSDEDIKTELKNARTSEARRWMELDRKKRVELFARVLNDEAEAETKMFVLFGVRLHGSYFDPGSFQYKPTCESLPELEIPETVGLPIILLPNEWLPVLDWFNSVKKEI
jgi:hypothetical protein